MAGAGDAAAGAAANAIEVADVHKVYRRYGRRKAFGTLKSAFLSGGVLRGIGGANAFEALRGVSFTVRRGQTFGVVGRNGSGKSTMLKLLAGIGKPTAGTLRVHGRVSALIELGAGFHPEISGRENVFINGMMLGMSRRHIAERFDEIVEFAGLEDFIDAPVKTYSSGMYMRLGFAVAINVDPDVLLVDEVLAVGDEAFTHKCLDKFADLKRQGRTVLLVTHMLDLVTRFCDEALWLDAGRVRGQGDPRRVIDAYLLDVAQGEDATLVRGEQRAAADPSAPASAAGQDEPPDMFRAGEGRWGSREAEITAVSVHRGDGTVAHVVESGAPFEVRVAVRAAAPLDDVVFGIGIFNAEGICCYGTNTLIEGIGPGRLDGEATASFRVDRLDLVEGTYKLDVAVHRPGGAPYDYHRLLHTIRVTARVKEVGIYRPPHEWQFSGSIEMPSGGAGRARS